MAVGEWERVEHSLREESLAGGVSEFWECLWVWHPSEP